MMFAFMVLINVKIPLLGNMCIPFGSSFKGKYLGSASVKINKDS